AAGAASAQITAGGGDAPKGGVRLEADLTAAAEVPGPGDPDLSGSADLRVDPRRNRSCFDVDLDASSDGADNVVALHIHPGVTGEACDTEDCPAPIDLEFANQGLEGCAKKLGTQLLNAIVEEPEHFYLHVHTSGFPAGAVRGQLIED
ncbi:MAG: CHRD domain-containing protein, partial [Myxococcota bacterium]